MPNGYDLYDYGRMVCDGARIDAYAAALAGAIGPGSVVLDLGAGPGLFALLACKYGASLVRAVEPDASIAVGMAAAAENGFSDRIEFVRAVSTSMPVPPSAADVVVSDLRGVLPLYQNHIPSIVDARERLLAPNGVMLPRRDTLYAALVRNPELHASYQRPWLHNPYGIAMTAGWDAVSNHWRRVELGADDLIVQPIAWTELDYRTVESPNVFKSMSFSIDQTTNTHGVAVWFDCDVDDENGFTNRPGCPPLVYGQAFFPWREQVDLEPGDEVTVTLAANLVNGDYVWRWKIDARSDGDTKTRTTHAHSSLKSEVSDSAALRQSRHDHVPTMTDAGRIDSFILSLMDGDHSLAQIADLASERFPDKLRTAAHALARAGELSVKYGERTAALRSST